MKDKFYLLVAIMLPLVFISCSSNKKTQESTTGTTAPAAPSNPTYLGDNSRVSLDWNGIYTGTLPCADCAGIKTMITLNTNDTYVMKTRYVGKSDEVFTNTGTITWDETGDKITLNGVGRGFPAGFHVGENILFQLDKNGQRVTGPMASKYELSKVWKSLVNPRWKLVEINGRPVSGMDLFKEPYIKLTGEAEGWRVSGNDGCNNIMGSYDMGDGNTISFGKMASTMMACPKKDLQAELNEVFSATDNFSLSDDGMTLTLNKARMAPLARFEADYVSGE